MNEIIEQVLGHNYSISEKKFKTILVSAAGSMEAARAAFEELEQSGQIQFQQINSRTRFVARSASYMDEMIYSLNDKITYESAFEIKSHYAYCTSNMSHASKWPYLWRLLCWVGANNVKS
jgi:hypothetical protein